MMDHGAALRPPGRLQVLAVDSRHRDASAYPNANSYVIRLDEEIRNVESVELVYAIYGTFGTERYVNMFVLEFEGGARVGEGSDAGAISGGYQGARGGGYRAVSGAFTQLPLIDPVNEYRGGTTHFRSVAAFRAPLGRLSRLTIRFVDAMGEPYPIRDHFLRFEVRCMERQAERESDLVQRLAAAPDNYGAWQYATPPGSPSPFASAPPPVSPVGPSPQRPAPAQAQAQQRGASWARWMGVRSSQPAKRRQPTGFMDAETEGLRRSLVGLMNDARRR